MDKEKTVTECSICGNDYWVDILIVRHCSEKYSCIFCTIKRINSVAEKMGQALRFSHNKDEVEEQSRELKKFRNIKNNPNTHE